MMPPLGTQSPLVRVGMPLVGGELLDYGVASGLPMMLSANAFARVDRNHEFVGFKLAAAEALTRDADLCLDSAGFTASALYGDYRWTVREYYDLVCAGPWTWHSAMDLCVEDEVAGDAGTRRLRIDMTIARYFECRNEASKRGCHAPVPVLQGRFADEYVRCAEVMGIPADVPLVGVGSVCRRHLHGPDGLIAIVAALDRALVPGVGLHLYGAKGGALRALRERGLLHRIRSVDSMAWDYSVRRSTPTGRTQFARALAMVDWHARQLADLSRATAETVPVLQPSPRRQEDAEIADEAVGAALADLCASNDISYRDATAHLPMDRAMVYAVLRNHGVQAFEPEDPEDDFGLGLLYPAVREAFVAAGRIAAG
jgi:hypothetical protein